MAKTINGKFGELNRELIAIENRISHWERVYDDVVSHENDPCCKEWCIHKEDVVCRRLNMLNNKLDDVWKKISDVLIQEQKGL